MRPGNGLPLERADSATLVARGETVVTRGEVRELSEELCARLDRDELARVLIRSNDPVQLLATIDACNRRGCDLWIAHTTISDEETEGLIARFGIQLFIGAETRSIDGANTTTEVSGRLHLMTSGTTGQPKVAVHTLESLMGRISGQAGFPANRGARWLLTYQPTAFAGMQVMLTAVASGGVIVAAEEGSGIAGIHAAALRHQATHVSGTPTFWRSFLLVAQPGALALRQITLGGEGVDQATLGRVAGAFPEARITHIYASTEAGVIFAVHDAKEGFPREWLETGVQGVQLRIREGSLQVRTPHQMQGYAFGASHPLTEDGWLVTSDRVEMEGDRVRILGRDDSIINVGGAKVYPQVVEAFLLGLAGVTEAKVSGVRNPISGFLVAADVVLAAGEDANEARVRILSQCRESLPSYQAPRILKVVDSIEIRASGKKG